MMIRIHVYFTLNGRLWQGFFSAAPFILSVRQGAFVKLPVSLVQVGVDEVEKVDDGLQAGGRGRGIWECGVMGFGEDLAQEEDADKLVQGARDDQGFQRGHEEKEDQGKGSGQVEPTPGEEVFPG